MALGGPLTSLNLKSSVLAAQGRTDMHQQRPEKCVNLHLVLCRIIGIHDLFWVC